MKYLRYAETTLGIMLELDNGQKIWGKVVGNEKFNAQAVFNLIKKNKINSNINLDMDEKNGQYFIKSVIMGAKTETVNNTSNVQREPAPVKAVVTEERRYELSYPDRYMSPKTPEESAQIKRLSVADSTAQIVSNMVLTLQGSVDQNNLVEIAKTYFNEIFDLIYNKV